MKLRHLIAAAFAAGTALAAPAQAGVLAASDLTVRSLFIVDTTTGTAVTSGILINSDSRTGTANSDFNGVQAVGVGSGNITSTVSGGTVDVKYRCAGPSCATISSVFTGGTPPPENDTTTHLALPAGNFAFGDMFLSGSAIGASGAQGMTRADASIANATNAGGANSTILNGVTATTKFTAATTRNMAFGMTYDSFVHVFIDALTLPGESGVASARMSWGLTLTDTVTGVDVISWNPTQLNKGFTISSPNDLSFASANTPLTPIFSNSATIISGRQYSLTVNQASNALASLVPEPDSVMLIGLGLIALGATVRRRRG